MLQAITSKSRRIFKKDAGISTHQAVLLPKDICDDNRWLTREATNEEILRVVNQINPLKTLGPSGIHIIFLSKKLTFHWKDIYLMVYGHLLKELIRTYLTLLLKKKIQKMYQIIDLLIFVMCPTNLYLNL